MNKWKEKAGKPARDTQQGTEDWCEHFCHQKKSKLNDPLLNVS